jgi:radical SAM superfamily enzyme YgiQ (UPF0313 family)
VRGAFRGHGVANLTLPYLAALIPHEHGVVIQDEQVAPLRLSDSIDLALITAKSCFSPRAYEVGDRLRSMGVPVVLGGCHVSINPEEALEHADAVVVGEAESVIHAVLRDAAGKRLKPLYRGEPVPLENLPISRRDLLQKRYLLDAIVVSRGCNYTCSFCCIRDFYGRGFRGRPIGEVVEEAKKLGPRLGFLDENLIGDRSYGRELFKALRPLGKVWLAQVSADIIEEPDLIELAARAGALGFLIGFETVNPANIRAMGKSHNRIEAYRGIVDLCHSHGISVAPGIVFGFDRDSVDTFPETLRILEELGVDLCLFKIVTPFPGTAYFRKLRSEGRILTEDWSYYDGHFPTFRPAGMTVRELFNGVQWIRERFYSTRGVLKRIKGYRRLKIPLWASINLNRLTRKAYRHANLLGGKLLARMESRLRSPGEAQEECKVQGGLRTGEQAENNGREGIGRIAEEGRQRRIEAS